MEATFITTNVPEILWLMASVAMAVTTVIVMYVAYWGALHYGFISLNEHGQLTLKPLNLPPGRMGLPIIGESIPYVKNTDQFLNLRRKRHGEIYKTHLLGFPCVVVSTHEAAKRFIVSHAGSLKAHAPNQVLSLLGQNFVDFQEGDMHTRLKKKFMKHLRPDSIKSMVPAIEEVAIKHISRWSNRSSIKFSDEIERYTLDIGMLAFFGPLPAMSAAKVNKLFGELEEGFRTLPINRPGYQYYEALQARNRLLKEVHDIVDTRQTEQNNSRPKDILDTLLDKEDPLPQNVIDDNAVGFLFASDRTTAGLISFTVKYLHDHPDVRQELKEEQEKIRNVKASGESLSWEDLKEMPLTYQVMQESMRLSNVTNMQYRLVEKELEYKGYIIPKGWRILSIHQQWHMDPDLFPDPYKFNPSRFQTARLGFSPFGMGAHLCAGYELARAEVLIFLHHFTTKCRWEILKDGPTQKNIFPHPYARLPIKLIHLNNDILAKGECAHRA